MKTATHLQHMIDGRIYPYSEKLAQRKDLRPVTLNAAGKVKDGGASHTVPGKMHDDLGKLLARLRDIEAQQAAIIEVISNMPGGEAILEAHNKPSAVALPPSDKPAPPITKPAPPTGAPVESEPEPEPEPELDQTQVAEPEPAVAANEESAPAPAATPEPVAEDPVMAAAEAELEESIKKVESQERYLAERTEVRDQRQEVVNELESALETADGEPSKKKIQAELEVAQETLKGAEIKVKSATTKLKNANTRYSAAQDAIDELNNPSDAE